MEPHTIGSIALAGGGTGGHVVPGLHLLERLVARGTPPARVLWFGAGRPIEDRVLAAIERASADGADGAEAPLAGVPFERVTLELEPPSGGAPGLGRLSLRTGPAVWKARRELRRRQVDVVLGLGGYTSLPVVLAARSLGIPVLLLEINAVQGRATRWMAPCARRVFHAWKSTMPDRGESPDGADVQGKHLHVGPPLASSFLAGAPSAEETRAARRALEFDPERPLLLVLGGSQGALGLNRFVREELAQLCTPGLQVLHQCGPGRLDEAAEPCPGYRPVEYLDDVALALAAATVVLSRGGASTLAEIAARARPAFVVPYPHHADQHQERNARLLGSGVQIVPEANLDRAFTKVIAHLAGPEGQSERARMSAALLSSVPGDACERIAAELAAIAAAP